MGRFTDQQKLEAAEREVRRRKRVFPVRITNHRMSSFDATKQIAIMEDIAADYRKRTELPLGPVPPARLDRRVTEDDLASLQEVRR